MTTKFMYIRNNLRQPFACVAMELDGDTCRYQVSTLSPADHHFDKDLGREIASGRLKKKPFEVSIKGVVNSGNAILAVVLRDIAKNSSLSIRTQKGAHDWLVEQKMD